jgi:hypothetical protein
LPFSAHLESRLLGRAWRFLFAERPADEGLARDLEAAHNVRPNPALANALGVVLARAGLDSAGPRSATAGPRV